MVLQILNKAIFIILKVAMVCFHCRLLVATDDNSADVCYDGNYCASYN